MSGITDFQIKKEKNVPISVVTCYDYWSARIIDETDIDAVLVGDSAAMVMHGFNTTVNAEIGMMSYHVGAVSRGLTGKFIIADMPFLAHRKGKKRFMNSVDKLMKAGAHAVKIEGGTRHFNEIKYAADSGVPVMGHIGLTPQSIHKLGGYKVQGKSNAEAESLMTDALALQEAGCFSIVLELVPAELAAAITNKLNIPTIGIGAGSKTSGQVLVLHDLLGFNKDFKPKFLRTFLNGHELVKGALDDYIKAVKDNSFPNDTESF